MHYRDKDEQATYDGTRAAMCLVYAATAVIVLAAVAVGLFLRYIGV